MIRATFTESELIRQIYNEWGFARAAFYCSNCLTIQLPDNKDTNDFVCVECEGTVFHTSRSLIEG